MWNIVSHIKRKNIGREPLRNIVIFSKIHTYIHILRRKMVFVALRACVSMSLLMRNTFCVLQENPCA